MWEKEAQAIIDDKRRSETQRLADLFNRLRKDDDFRKVEENYTDSMFQLSKAKALNLDVKASENAVLEAENAYYDFALKNYNLQRKELSAQYECKKCQDTGYIDGNRCDCFYKKILKICQEMGDCKIKDTDFSNFDLNAFKGDAKKNAENVIKFLQNWISAYPKLKTHFVTLSGKTGVGKTHLASIVNNAFNQRGFTTAFFSSYRLNELFLEARLANSKNRAQMLSQVLEPELLVIDDLGSEQNFQNVTLEYLYLAILERGDKATIITTNLDVEMLKQRYQERFSSRLTGDGGKLITLFGEDYRQKK